MVKCNKTILGGKKMRKTKGILALALGSIMALAAFAGCGGGSKSDRTGARICYDNLPDDGISIAAEDTTYTLKNVTSRKEYGVDGAEVPEGTVVSYENDVVTAKSAGLAEFTLKDDSTFSVEVVPAYTTDPGNQFTGAGDEVAQSGSTLGGTHDPSLIETVEDGKPAYYIFSTGWRTGNEIRRSTDLIHWQYMGKATKSDTEMSKIDEWISQPNSKGGISWWAPDIVPASGGGYWLYTCCTLDDAFPAPNPDGAVSGYSPACIVLFKSDSLKAESFRYVGVLMQSFIPKVGGDIDVNSIDPQIIYDPDGNMYMAYGSFGTGNWMLELNPKTGLRKDDFYKNGVFLDWKQVRTYRDEATLNYTAYKQGDEVKHSYYGTMISQGAMEAPVIARHDNVTVSDETGKVLEEGKTFYYSMHSYNGLDVAYQMWGGRSESPWGRYTSTGGAGIYNERQGAATNSGNKYMGSFTWSNKAEGVFEPDIVLPGHNDLFTTSKGLSVAAYITRTASYQTGNLAFMSQIHQYYLNSFGDICINPNRFGKEIDRTVTKDELFKYTDGGKFKMIALENGLHAQQDASVSVDVVLSEDGKISYEGKQIGSWLMYGKGYIKLSFTVLNAIPTVATGLQETYYGVVRPAWLNDQNKSGFTITSLSRGMTDRSLALFMNNYSTLDVK